MGGGAAGLVLAAVTVPRAVLMLLGGTVADRFGPRAVQLAADLAMAGVGLVALACVAGLSTPLWLLVALAAGLVAGSIGVGAARRGARAGVGIVAGLVDGLGPAMVIAHAGPVTVARAPATHLSRMQALLGWCSRSRSSRRTCWSACSPPRWALGTAALVAGTRRSFDRDPERRRTGIEPA